jgi:nucleoside-diphosphate-sugar epimerase
MTRTVLLTGASGVVGRAVAAELTDCHVIGLAHSDTTVPEVDEVLPADLSKPKLGLDDQTWARLAGEVESVVHSGALTQWGQDPARYQAINVDGTARVVELAKAAGAPVHMVSTCFVHAIELGRVGELNPDNVVRPYIESKLAAERVLADSGLRHSIFRPTNMVGDSRTGASSRPQIVQQMSDWIGRGKAPYFPLHPGNLVDIAPMDTLSIPVAEAVRQDRADGLFWVTYGERGMTAEHALEIIAEHALRRSGRTIPPAPIVDPTLPPPVPMEQVPALSRAFLKVLVDVSETTKACGGVLPTSLPELCRDLKAPDVSDTDAFRLSLDYWADERSGGNQ